MVASLRRLSLMRNPRSIRRVISEKVEVGRPTKVGGQVTGSTSVTRDNKWSDTKRRDQIRGLPYKLGLIRRRLGYLSVDGRSANAALHGWVRLIVTF